MLIVIKLVKLNSFLCYHERYYDLRYSSINYLVISKSQGVGGVYGLALLCPGCGRGVWFGSPLPRVWACVI